MCRHVLLYDFHECSHYFCVFFFFKQKTAYEMRISDWSSDVCSSDLATGSPGSSGAESPRPSCRAPAPADSRAPPDRRPRPHDPTGCSAVARGSPSLKDAYLCPPVGRVRQERTRLRRRDRSLDLSGRAQGRSEEHTSELQSLMRISYAV